MMKKNPYLSIILISSLIAIVVVVVLKILGHDNAIVIGGAVAGGITGSITTSLMNKNKE